MYIHTCIVRCPSFWSYRGPRATSKSKACSLIVQSSHAVSKTKTLDVQLGNSLTLAPQCFAFTMISCSVRVVLILYMHTFFNLQGCPDLSVVLKGNPQFFVMIAKVRVRMRGVCVSACVRACACVCLQFWSLKIYTLVFRTRRTGHQVLRNSAWEGRAPSWREPEEGDSQVGQLYFYLLSVQLKALQEPGTLPHPLLGVYMEEGMVRYLNGDTTECSFIVLIFPIFLDSGRHCIIHLYGGYIAQHSLCCTFSSTGGV